MIRIVSLLASLVLVATLSFVSVLHAAEPQGLSALSAVATVAEVAAGHASGDPDQVPADNGRGVPHHHGCHGDHVAAPISQASDAGNAFVRSPPYTAVADVRPRGTADPTLRPPKA